MPKGIRSTPAAGKQLLFADAVPAGTDRSAMERTENAVSRRPKELAADRRARVKNFSAALPYSESLSVA